MILYKKHPDFHSGGAYGAIFFHSGDKAVKVFRKDISKPIEHIRNVFFSEVGAYEIAQNISELNGIVPKFYGVVSVDRIENAAGDDISDQFHLNLAYEMEKLDGPFIKAGHAGLDSVKVVTKVLHANRIMHTSDMDVLIIDGEIKKIIDFAIQEYELEW